MDSNSDVDWNAGQLLVVAEQRLDFQGEAHCRRPVFRGHFVCPPKDDLTRTTHLTLPDGTGICIRSQEDYDLEFEKGWDSVAGLYPELAEIDNS